MAVVACVLTSAIGVVYEQNRLPGKDSIPFALEDSQLVVGMSGEAALRGITIGQAVSAARTLCPTLLVLPYDRPAYEAYARATWDRLAVETSTVEPVSPECCYAALEECRALSCAQEAAADIAKRLRMGVRVGIGSSKLVARYAALNAAGDQPNIVHDGGEAHLLRHVKVGDVTALPPKLLARLGRLGISTLGDVRRVPAERIERTLGHVALLLRCLAAGQDSDPVRAYWPMETVSHRIPFDYSPGIGSVQGALQGCAMRIATRLAHQRKFCTELTCILEREGALPLRATERMTHPQQNAGALTVAALRLLERIAPRDEIAAVELSACGISCASGVQLALPGVDEAAELRERHKQIDAAMSQVRRRFGGAALIPARALLQTRRIDLWTDALSRRMSCKAAVTTDSESGLPTEVAWRGTRYDVDQVLARWIETRWEGEESADRAVWRVSTRPKGCFELQQAGANWFITGVAD